MTLAPATETLWQQYVELERRGVRRTALPALERFIDALLREDEPVWRGWALELAARASDTDSHAPIRYPLFDRVLLPALTEGVLRGVPGCARWLAQFESELLSVGKTPLPEQLRTSVGLLLEALRVDPADRLTRERLVDRWASQLRYTLHELPAGILYGFDGATPEQCGELLDLLNEFREHVERLNQQARYAELIAECDFHYRSYRDYQQHGPPSISYAEFLRRKSP